MSRPISGLLDTNVFIHALSNDAHSNECRAFLGRVETGEVTVQLELCVVHELTYVYSRYMKPVGRPELSTILMSVVEWPGVAIEHRDSVRLGLEMWGRTPRTWICRCLLDRKEPIAVPACVYQERSGISPVWSTRSGRLALKQ